MEWLNYHHLFYFWVISREGSLTAAGRVLRVSHATLSTQVKALEASLGHELFSRTKGRLVLTVVGRRVAEYAAEIFGLGRELLDDVRRGAEAPRLRAFQVGLTESVPKLVVRRLLDPALRLADPVRLVCKEAEQGALLAELARGTLDLVIADAPVPPGSAVKAFTHVLGESAMGWFASPALADRMSGKFPRALQGMPVLLPLDGTPLRRAIDQWLSEHDLQPRIVGEFQDSALIKAFGHDAIGAFPGPVAVEAEVANLYGVSLLGTMRGVSARVFAISAERRVRHPAVAAIVAGARDELLA